MLFITFTYTAVVTVQFEQSSFDLEEGEEVPLCGELQSGSLGRDVIIRIYFEDDTAVIGLSIISCDPL